MFVWLVFELCRGSPLTGLATHPCCNSISRLEPGPPAGRPQKQKLNTQKKLLTHGDEHKQQNKQEKTNSQEKPTGQLPSISLYHFSEGGGELCRASQPATSQPANQQKQNNNPPKRNPTGQLPSISLDHVVFFVFWFSSCAMPASQPASQPVTSQQASKPASQPASQPGSSRFQFRTFEFYFFS